MVKVYCLFVVLLGKPILKVSKFLVVRKSSEQEAPFVMLDGNVAHESSR